MKQAVTLLLAGLITAVLAVACGGGGVPLSNFPALNATEGDAPLTLSAPSSKSPGAFSYTSSDPAVATVAGNILTIGKAGTSTITASQPEVGSYRPTSITALLTVKARSCTAPAALSNNACVAPATTGNFVGSGALTFAPVTRLDTWSNASAFCSTSTINGQTGWRLPTQAELITLAAPGALSNAGWTLGATWSSSSSLVNAHDTVNLATAAVVSNTTDSSSAYVSCAR
jgi:hypothetical protein